MRGSFSFSFAWLLVVGTSVKVEPQSREKTYRHWGGNAWVQTPRSSGLQAGEPSPEAFPYATATGLTYDSGNFEPALEQALVLADYASVRQAQKSRDVTDPLLGVGLATVVKASGGSGEMKESHALIRVEPTGQ